MPPSDETRRCPACSSDKPLAAFSRRGAGRGPQSMCKTCNAARSRARRKAIPGVDRDGHLRRAYGITQDDYLAMLKAQRYVCAICQQGCITGNRLSVDHDHTTGAVRGLLCGRCNRGIGLLCDSPATLRAAAVYLENSAARNSP